MSAQIGEVSSSTTNGVSNTAVAPWLHEHFEFFGRVFCLSHTPDTALDMLSNAERKYVNRRGSHAISCRYVEIWEGKDKNFPHLPTISSQINAIMTCAQKTAWHTKKHIAEAGTTITLLTAYTHWQHAIDRITVPHDVTARFIFNDP
jgi:hypothetical protein